MAYNNRGCIRMEKKNDIDGAISDFEKAISLKQENHEALNYARINLYKAYNVRGIKRDTQSGDLNGAIYDFTSAINLFPNEAEAYRNRGSVRYRNNDKIGTLNDYQKFNDLGGGVIQGIQKKLEESIQLLKEELGIQR